MPVPLSTQQLSTLSQNYKWLLQKDGTVKTETTRGFADVITRYTLIHKQGHLEELANGTCGDCGANEFCCTDVSCCYLQSTEILIPFGTYSKILVILCGILLYALITGIVTTCAWKRQRCTIFSVFLMGIGCILPVALFLFHFFKPRPAQQSFITQSNRNGLRVASFDSFPFDLSTATPPLNLLPSYRSLFDGRNRPPSYSSACEEREIGKEPKTGKQTKELTSE